MLVTTFILGRSSILTRYFEPATSVARTFGASFLELVDNDLDGGKFTMPYERSILKYSVDIVWG